MQQLWNDMLAVLKAPFAGPIDLVQLFLIVGAVLVFVALWVLILNHVRLAAQEV